MKKFDKDKYLRKLKFKRYWQTNSRYFYIGIPCLLCLILGIYFAYSKFFVSSEEEVIRTTVGKFIYGDVIMTPYVDGEYSSTFPEKKTGINVEKVVCDNGVTASWDEDKWRLYATNLSKRTKCSVYFVTPASCGTNNNVSCINSREGLVTLANEVNNGDNKSGKIIYLTSDLDLGGKFDSEGNAFDGNISWTPIGTDSNPFSGTFDGNGHIINNMYVNADNKTGLFNYISYGEIKNVGIENSYVITKNTSAAGIAGQVLNGRIINSYNASSVNGVGASGIVNFTDNSDILNCYNIGTINGNSSQFSGGIVYYFGNSNHKAIIRNVYNLGSVSCKKEAAGISGGFQGIIENAFNIGTINGDTCSAGIVGQMFTYTYPTIKNSYNVGKSSGGGIAGCLYEDYAYKLSNNYYLKGAADYGFYGKGSDEGAEPLSQDEMPSVISVINGDNAFVEDTNNINNGYPILKWQAERENN